jgi:hypothetical protein
MLQKHELKRSSDAVSEARKHLDFAKVTGPIVPESLSRRFLGFVGVCFSAAKTRFVEPDQSDLGRPVPYQKIFCFSLHPNHLHNCRRLTPLEGRIAIVTDVGRGMRWTQAALKTRALPSRTAKSCGPDASTPASSS